MYDTGSEKQGAMTGNIRITKEFSFEMAHALWNYDGACKNIHGHSYRLFVTLLGTPISDSSHPKFGMVMDFSELKDLVITKVVDVLDHSLVVYREADGDALRNVRRMYEKVHVFDFQPTCEYLVLHIARIISEALPDGMKLHNIKLYETATSFAEWHADDNP
jgi:6-pyruvoyltetrahydropterin/6-carboxytetrahydropterin synthase